MNGKVALLGLSMMAAVLSIAACGVDAPSTTKKGGAKGANGGFGNGNGGTFGDFPEPFAVDGAPDDSAKLFADAGDGNDSNAAAPCLIEPQPGTLFPKNWLPPRFSWVASGSSNLYELHVKAENQTQDLVVYTGATSWTMSKEMWDAIREHSADVPMTAFVRGAIYEGGAIHDVTGVNGGDLGIAPVEAPGSIVFWSIAAADNGSQDGESLLKGFTVGEARVVDVLRKENMPTPSGQKARTCIGCHTSTPDGKDVAVAWEAGEGQPTGVDVVRIEKGSAPGPRESYVTPNATSKFASGAPMFSTFSRSHWAAGDRLMLTNSGADLIWIDLEAKSPNAATGILGKAGDSNPRRLGPSWSRDGNQIVYMSGELGTNPFELKGPSDLFAMPFASKDGATAQNPAAPIAGASDPNRAEYYPALSPDDAWVAFNALPDNGSLYDNPNAEIFLVKKSGGERVRLSANDPPACQAKRSPGITNSWPKWAPEVQDHNGRRFYFLVFSSRRNLQTERPQLYVAPIRVDGNGDVTTYPAIYVRNQESVADWQKWGNHTPAWDVFAIEPAVVK